MGKTIFHIFFATLFAIYHTTVTLNDISERGKAISVTRIVIVDIAAGVDITEVSRIARMRRTLTDYGYISILV